MKSIYQSPSFKKLQKEWYAKLTMSGFVDIERVIGSEQTLIQSSGHPYRYALDETTRDSKQTYFELLSERVATEKFDSLEDELILTKRSEGFQIKEIHDLLCSANQKRHRNTIRFTIRKYEVRWGIKKYKPNQLNQHTNPDGSKKGKNT